MSPWLPRVLAELSCLGAEFTASSLWGELFQPRMLFGMAARMGLLSAETLASALPGKQGLAWQELANKVEAWHLFSYADRITVRNQTLTEIADQVSQLDPFHAVWLAEGLGYFYSIRAMSEHRCVGLFQTRDAEALPVRTVIPLHTGSGLAFAEAALQGSDLRGLPDKLHDLWQFCSVNARESFAEMTFEALGLVAITLYPGLVTPIEQELARSANNLVSYFWHGLGRGLYFLPSTFIPVSSILTHALALTQRLPATDEGRSNALAGLGWAITLVNIRHPEVLAQFLSEHERQITDLVAFSNGVTSAIKLWRLVAPDDPHLALFYDWWDQQRPTGFEAAPPTANSPGGLFHVPADGLCRIC